MVQADSTLYCPVLTTSTMVSPMSSISAQFFIFFPLILPLFTLLLTPVPISALSCPSYPPDYIPFDPHPTLPDPFKILNTPNPNARAQDPASWYDCRRPETASITRCQSKHHKRLHGHLHGPERHLYMSREGQQEISNENQCDKTQDSIGPNLHPEPISER